MPKNDKYLQCVEFNNMYIDTTENVNRVTNILALLNHDTYSCSYAYILHDKDKYLTDTFNDKFELIGHCGDLKKPHYHCYVKFTSPVLIDKFELQFNVKPCDYHVFKPKDFVNKLLYLSHVNYPDKFKYDYHDICSNIPDFIEYLNCKKALDNKDILMDTMEFLNSADFDYYFSTESVIKYLYSCGWKLHDIKGAIYTINLLINDHNRMSERTSSFLEQKALEYMHEHNYFDKKIVSVVENFGFGRFDINGEEYICCKANKKKTKKT